MTRLVAHCHPLLPALYVAGAVGLTLAAAQPVFVAVSFACGAACTVFLLGWRSFVRRLPLYLPGFALVTAGNGLFSGLGLTVLFYMGGSPVTLEGLAYGACAGAMLLGVLQWCGCLQALLPAENAATLLGRALPSLAMLLAMLLRAVPQQLRRAQEARAAQEALLGGKGRRDTRTRFRQGLRLATVLLGWSMEDTIDTADAMRARGWGLGKRSRCERRHFAKADAVGLALLLALLVGALAALLGAGRFEFYPYLDGGAVSPIAVLLYAAFLCWPLLIELREVPVWMRSPL